MRLHSDKLTRSDLLAATHAAGMRGVFANITERGSRSRATGWDVYLTGTSSRRPNGRDRDQYAATWDEWGMFLAALYAIDPDMIAGSGPRSAAYLNADDFHTITRERYQALTAPYQHGGGGHRWRYSLDTGDAECEDCGARREHPATTMQRRRTEA